MIVLKIVVFVLIGIVILNIITPIIAGRAADKRTYQWYGAFYDQKKDSLDAVYIGSSSTYSAWVPTFAWKRYGIAGCQYVCSGQPFIAAEYVIRETRKTQPNALYIVPLRPTDSISSTKLHYLVDNMPFSLNKIQTIRAMGKYMGASWKDLWEYLFPVFRYHSRWSSLTREDVFQILDGYNGSSYYSGMRKSVNVSSSYHETTRRDELSGTLKNAIDSLLKYCEEEQVNVLFVETAGLKSKHNIAMVNSMRDIVEARGYPVVSLRPITGDVVDLDMTKDYYNAGHTNIHGAIKITDYLSRYMVENYGFEDKRGDPDYRSWDEAYTNYITKYASAYTLDVEWEGEPRDRALSEPVLTTVAAEDAITVSWDAVPGAEGYRIYRKNASKNSWQIIDTVDAAVRSYDDRDCKEGTTYYYTVIPYRDEDGVRYWGEYNYIGITEKLMSH